MCVWSYSSKNKSCYCTILYFDNVFDCAFHSQSHLFGATHISRIPQLDLHFGLVQSIPSHPLLHWQILDPIHLPSFSHGNEHTALMICMAWLLRSAIARKILVASRVVFTNAAISVGVSNYNAKRKSVHLLSSEHKCTVKREECRWWCLSSTNTYFGFLGRKQIMKSTTITHQSYGSSWDSLNAI